MYLFILLLWVEWLIHDTGRGARLELHKSDLLWWLLGGNIQITGIFKILGLKVVKGLQADAGWHLRSLHLVTVWIGHAYLFEIYVRCCLTFWLLLWLSWRHFTVYVISLLGFCWVLALWCLPFNLVSWALSHHSCWHEAVTWWNELFFFQHVCLLLLFRLYLLWFNLFFFLLNLYFGFYFFIFNCLVLLLCFIDYVLLSLGTFIGSYVSFNL